MPHTVKHQFAHGPSDSVEEPPVENAVTILAQKISSTFQLPVYIVDQMDQVVASSDEQASGQQLALETGSRSQAVMRIPILVDEQQYDVVLDHAQTYPDVGPGIVRTVVKQLWSQITDIQKTPVRRTPRDHFLYSLLHDDDVDELAAREQGQLFGLDLGHPGYVILIDAADLIVGAYEYRTRSTCAGHQLRAQQLLKRMASYLPQSAGSICAYLGQGQLLILHSAYDPPDGTEEQRSRELAPLIQRLSYWLFNNSRRDPRIAAGPLYSGVARLARSYQNARAILRQQAKLEAQPQRANVHYPMRLPAAPVNRSVGNLQV